MIAASASSLRALRTWCGHGAAELRRLSRSDSSTLAVPDQDRASRRVQPARSRPMTAASFSALVGNTASGSSTRTTGRFVGMRLDVEAVDLAELVGLRRGGARHAAHGRIERDQVLDRDRAEHPSLPLRRHAFLQLERRLQTGRPSPVVHDAAFELVDREDRLVLNDVVDVLAQEDVRVQRVLDGRQRAGGSRSRRGSCDSGRAPRASTPAGVSDTLRPGGSTVKWRPRARRAHDAIRAGGRPWRVGGAAGDHERNPRFVDQDGIGFVDDGGGKRPMHLLVRVEARADRAGSRSRLRSPSRRSRRSGRPHGARRWSMPCWIDGDRQSRATRRSPRIHSASRRAR